MRKRQKNNQFFGKAEKCEARNQKFATSSDANLYMKKWEV